MKAKIITLLLLVVSFFTVSITYAWMNIESLHETDRFIELDLRDSAGHSLSIEEIEFSASLYIYDHGQSSFVNLPVNQTELFEVNGWIPGKYVDYRVDITNSSSIEQSYSLSLKGLSTSYTGENNIFDYIALSVYRITGLNYYPDLPEINVGEKMSSIGSVKFYDGFTIPSDTTCSIYFTLLFSEDATIEFEGTQITIGKLVIAQI